jgi:hypothetical protein
MGIKILKQGYWIVAIALLFSLCISPGEGSDVMIIGTQVGVVPQVVLQGTIVVPTTTPAQSEMSVVMPSNNQVVQEEIVRKSVGEIPMDRSVVSCPLEVFSTGVCNHEFTINSLPQGADLYVDGDLWGPTPQIRTLLSTDVNPGSHDILLKKSGYIDFIGTVDFYTGKDTWTFPLVQKTQVTSQQPVNPEQQSGSTTGQSSGSTTGQSSGSTTGQSSGSTTGQSSGSTADLISLNIDSIPSGAQLSLDSHACGHTPATVSIKSGPHTILLSKPGFRDYSIIVTISRDSYLSYSLESVAGTEPTTTMPGTTKGSFPLTALVVALVIAVLATVAGRRR